MKELLLVDEVKVIEDDAGAVEVERRRAGRRS